MILKAGEISEILNFTKQAIGIIQVTVKQLGDLILYRSTKMNWREFTLFYEIFTIMIM